MAWTQDELNEIQIYLQMYDKQMVSKKTVLEKIGVDSDSEEKLIIEETEREQKRRNMRQK